MTVHVGGAANVVLIVDDDPDIRDSFCDVLADEGITAVGAEHGAAALAYLASHPLPCVIVLDLMMPVMTGAEFRAKQLAEPRLASIPVIVMSASDRGSAIATELGAQAFLPKPAPIAQLIQAVHRFC